jgi:hypothetical protein
VKISDDAPAKNGSESRRARTSRAVARTCYDTSAAP